MDWLSSEWIFLLLAVLVIAFGIGVVALNRRRTALEERPPVLTPPARPPEEDVPEGVDAVVDTVERADAVPEPAPPVEPEPPANLRARMARARSTLSGAFSSVLGRSGIDEESWEDLEEALIRADVGVKVTTDLLDHLRAQVAADKITDPAALLDMLRAEMRNRLATADRSLHHDADGEGPSVWMFVGVNGVGKTTTIGKVAAQQTALGRSVLLAAGDTFRAAAAEQLSTWAERAGAEFVRGAEGGDPSSVIFDGVERATARSIDLVLADTAGRLHTKTNLMEELRKVRRVAEKGAGRVTETLLVIDATTGQNGLVQAREFAEVTDVTGVVLTKLDGSAKGGIVFAIETEMGLPVKLVGVGETAADLIGFDPAEFVDALFDAT